MIHFNNGKLVILAIVLGSAIPTSAQTLGTPFGNPSKPATQAQDKEILNNDDFLDGEKTNYCKTINETCYVQQPGFAGNQCSCERNGRFSNGKFIKKGQLN